MKQETNILIMNHVVVSLIVTQSMLYSKNTEFVALHLQEVADNQHERHQAVLLVLCCFGLDILTRLLFQ